MKARRKLREAHTHGPWWGLLVCAVACCYIAYQAVVGVINLYDSWVSDLPSIDNVQSMNYAQESYMYADDGTTLLAEFQLEKRNPVTYDEISPYVLNATVATEDERFYSHNGVDPQGIVRALVNNLRGGELEGASTITQQLVRNTVLSEEATDISLERKAREAELAIRMEKRYSKQEILTMYLNTINYGDGCYGIEAAAENYFQVSAADLTIAQAATLVGIPQSPTQLNPKTFPDACLARRNIVLSRMVSQGYITQEEYQTAVASPLNLNPKPDLPYQGIFAYPYFTSYVRDQLLSSENVYGCSYADLFTGGLTIYTTLNPTLQDCAESACENQYASMSDDLDAALVAMDPTNGHVQAIVGGRDFYTDQWNIATQGGRPSGSTFKVFTLVAALEHGWTASTAVDCSNPVTLESGQTINNFGYANYGTRTLQDATAISSNTGYYRIAQQLGASTLISTAQRMGITSSLSPYPIITLGTENVTPLEMADAYSTLATGGVHHDPVIITKIVDKNGNVLYEESDTSSQVLDKEIANSATSILRAVFESSSGTAYGSGLSSGQPVAGKTGTGVEYRDHWLVGYTPYLTCAAWIGNRDYSSTSPSLNANSLWHDFMTQACAGHAIENFEAPASASSSSSTSSSANGTSNSSGSSSSTGDSTSSSTDSTSGTTGTESTSTDSATGTTDSSGGTATVISDGNSG